MRTHSRLLHIIVFLLPGTLSICQNEISSPKYLDHAGCKSHPGAQHQLDMPNDRNFAAAHTDMVYQEMHIEMDPAVNHIEGVITYHFQSKKDNLSQLVLDYGSTLPIHFIRRNSEDLTYTQMDNLLIIDLGIVLAEGQYDTIQISYESDDKLSFNVHNGNPILTTTADLASLWYPGKKDLVDKIDSVDIYVTTPIGQLAAGNGILVSITENNGKLVHHWKHRHPIATTYLLNIAVTNYAVHLDTMILPDGDMLPLLNYIYPEDLAAVLPEVAAIPDIMLFFIEKFGNYPFDDEKYGHAQYSDGGALEVQTMSFMGFFDFGVIAHELAHQWFGNYVTCASLQDMWLNEGWAEYLEGLAIERLRQSDWNGLKVSKINSATSAPDGSVFVKDTVDLSQLFNGRLVYNKGFYVAHMLRWLVGDSLFYEACYNYLHDTDHIDGFASLSGLSDHFEAVSGQNLDEFFADWYYGEGFPSYTVNWIQEQDSVILWVKQAQSHSSVSFFEMPIPIIAYRFGVVADTVFHHTYDNQRFSLYVGNNSISQIIFDQEKWILSKNNNVIKLTTSISSPAGDDRYTVFPNPAYTFIEIENATEIRELDIINLSGVTLTRYVVGNKVDVGDLTPGHYVMLLRNNNAEVVSKQSIMIIR